MTSSNSPHSNYGGYDILTDKAGLYYVREPFLNHSGLRRWREVGGYQEHRQAREYIQANCMDWMAMADKINNG